MTVQPAIIPIVEKAAERLIDTENAFYDAEGLDDNEHLPRLGRIVGALCALASDEGGSEADVSEMKQRLLRYAEDEYLKRWMEDLDDDEDPDTVRREGVKVFRRVLGGGSR